MRDEDGRQTFLHRDQEQEQGQEHERPVWAEVWAK